MEKFKDLIEPKFEMVLNQLEYYDPKKHYIILIGPKTGDFGDYSANVAQMAREAKKSPREIAQEICDKLLPILEAGFIEKVEAAGIGFINFYPGWEYYREELRNIILEADNFGCSTQKESSKKIQVEFVSANPTGPLNVVSARAATVGDVMVNLYNAIGHQADREYYINDVGRQIRLLGASVSSLYMALFDKSEEFPEEGYHGEYIKDLAHEIAKEYGEQFAHLNLEERHQKLSQIALTKMIDIHKSSMEQFRVNFQTWFNESQLRDKNEHLDVLKKLGKEGFTYQHEGAIWFKSQQFGDEKDRVLVTSEGEPTYFLVDIAYHQNKFQRGYQTVYDIWGPDHHGYIPRMKAAIEALGYSAKNFDVHIVQQVNLLRGGEVVKMSKRAGKIIEMQEVIDEVGVDAARFFFIDRTCNSHLDFDIDLAKKQSDENPVYYVQYAHARICSIIRHAEEQGISFDESVDLKYLNEKEEKDLIRELLLYPDVIHRAATLWEPHYLPSYLYGLANTFHHFYHIHRVVTDDIPLSKARLLLCKATQIVFANGLKILGITAPERM